MASALDAIQRLLAPFLPFAAEEAWSWWRPESIHIQPWPVATNGGGEAELLDPVLEVLALVRRSKTEAKVSQRAAVANLTITVPATQVMWVEFGSADLAEAGSVTTIDVYEGDGLSCEVVLEPADGSSRG